jgi:hypothetical protein
MGDSEVRARSRESWKNGASAVHVVARKKLVAASDARDVIACQEGTILMHVVIGQRLFCTKHSLPALDPTGKGEEAIIIYA